MRTITFNTPLEKVIKYRKANAIRFCRKLKQIRHEETMNDMERRAISRNEFIRAYREMI